MSNPLGAGEKAQLEQTIEMFEVITQSQPQDYQSLEILKEAYSKLDRNEDVIKTSKRIAEAYVQLGQLSSAILEYETILQLHPDDPDVQAALKAIEGRATNLSSPPGVVAESASKPAPATGTAASAPKTGKAKVEKSSVPGKDAGGDDGRAAMQKFFVDSKIISIGDFDSCWPTSDLNTVPGGVIDPFIQVLADKKILPIERSLKVLVEKSRLAYLPLDKYDIDADLTRKFPVEACRRWCVLPFDHMSKTVFVATANPFNKEAAHTLAHATQNRIVWYLASPMEINLSVRKAFRLK
jgi:tetratricopeptide (TPR) repeat protein